ncbi:hypothetical protein EMIT0P44_320030 [Pseudomonas sp. IT-P44]
MAVNDNAGYLNERVAQTIFASKPSSTGDLRTLLIFTTHQAER